MGSQEAIQKHLGAFFGVHEAEVSSVYGISCRIYTHIYILKIHPDDSVRPLSDK